MYTLQTRRGTRGRFSNVAQYENRVEALRAARALAEGEVAHDTPTHVQILDDAGNTLHEAMPFVHSASLAAWNDGTHPWAKANREHTIAEIKASSAPRERKASERRDPADLLLDSLASGIERAQRATGRLTDIQKDTLRNLFERLSEGVVAVEAAPYVAEGVESGAPLDLSAIDSMIASAAPRGKRGASAPTVAA